jgi:LCP family protein required for cell wall assembly
MTRETTRPYGRGVEPDESRPPYLDEAPMLRRRHWGRRTLAVLLAPVVLLAAFCVYLEVRLHREPVFGGTPAGTATSAGGRGTNWLIVGSDSRDGLSKAQRREYHTGGGVGKRTDSMMLLHVGDRDRTLVSLPRDSYLPIPGHGANKLNAAFAAGGPRLLARTIEQSSGLRIDHYAEIGFGGFVGMVDAVGGVRMCIDAPVRDKKAGIDLRAGCQRLDGRAALGYVRSRHAFAGGDLDRVKHQQEFLAALVHRATSPGVLANPVRIVPFAQRAAAAVSVADGDHLWDLARFAWVMREIAASGGRTTTVPIKGSGTKAGVGEYVRWDLPRAAALFAALRDDRPVSS